MQSKEELIIILDKLELSNISQQEKEQYYQRILFLRQDLLPIDFDSIGFNLLHWAVLCLQPIDVIASLIDTHRIDVNVGTRYVDIFNLFNVTPLRFAVQTNNEALSYFLLEQGADPCLKVKIQTELYTPISKQDCSYVQNGSDTKEFALRKANSTFKFFDIDLVQEYCNKRQQNDHEYDSILPIFMCKFLYYTKTEQLNAAAAFILLLTKDRVQDQLQNLKKTHPAVNVGELGQIYHASLRAGSL